MYSCEYEYIEKCIEKCGFIVSNDRYLLIHTEPCMFPHCWTLFSGALYASVQQDSKTNELSPQEGDTALSNNSSMLLGMIAECKRCTGTMKRNASLAEIDELFSSSIIFLDRCVAVLKRRGSEVCCKPPPYIENKNVWGSCTILGIVKCRQ